MWQPGWEGSLGENEYMHMYDWVPLLLTWSFIGYAPIQSEKLKKKKYKAEIKLIKKAKNENNICKIFSTSIYLVQLNMKNELEVKEFSMVIVNIFSNLKILWALVLKKFILFNPMLAV